MTASLHAFCLCDIHWIIKQKYFQHCDVTNCPAPRIENVPNRDTNGCTIFDMGENDVIMIKGIWALFSLLFIFLWNRKPWLDNFVFIITLECSKLWIWMGIYFRNILLIRISRGTNNCVQRVFEELFIMRFPPIFNCFNSMKAWKKSKGLIMQVYFQSILWSYLPRVSIILTTTVCVCVCVCVRVCVCVCNYITGILPASNQTQRWKCGKATFIWMN